MIQGGCKEIVEVFLIFGQRKDFGFAGVAVLIIQNIVLSVFIIGIVAVGEVYYAVLGVGDSVVVYICGVFNFLDASHFIRGRGVTESQGFFKKRIKIRTKIYCIFSKLYKHLR